MTVTQDEARMLTALVLASRPHGAPHWDAGGVMAQIRKVSGQRLPDVIRAAINAAEDRTLVTPGAISNMAASCWRTTPATPVSIRDTWGDLSDRCAECSRRRATCESDRNSGHEFLSIAERQHQLDERAVDVRATVEGIKQIAATQPEETHP